MKRTYVITSILCFALCQQITFASYTIDGDLSDWGVSLFQNWTPISPTADFNEADNENTHNATAYEEYYDMEALYMDDDEDNIYIAAVTSYTGSIGDIFLDLDGDMKIDSPGRASGFDAAIQVGTSDIYVGNPTEFSKTPVSTFIKKASEERLGSDTTYITSGDYAYQGSPFQIIKSNGIEVGTADLALKESSDSDVPDEEDPTYTFEMSISKSILGLTNHKEGDPIGIHFTMYCGNDSINLIGDLDKPIPPVPAPSAIFLTGIGATIVSHIKRRRHS